MLFKFKASYLTYTLGREQRLTLSACTICMPWQEASGKAFFQSWWRREIYFPDSCFNKCSKRSSTERYFKFSKGWFHHAFNVHADLSGLKPRKGTKVTVLSIWKTRQELTRMPKFPEILIKIYTKCFERLCRFICSKGTTMHQRGSVWLLFTRI